MQLLLFGVVSSLLVEFRLEDVDLNERHGLVLVLQVVESSAGRSVAQVNESLTAHSELSNRVDLEVMSLLVHVAQEDGQVLWDLVLAYQVLGVVSNVQFGHKFLAGSVDLLNGIRELSGACFGDVAELC